MWTNFVTPNRLQITIQCMLVAWWIPKATNAYSKYVIPIDFPLQQWLHGRASLLRYTYIASPVTLVCRYTS